MRKLISIIGLSIALLLCLVSCTKYTCPTYSSNNYPTSTNVEEEPIQCPIEWPQSSKTNSIYLTDSTEYLYPRTITFGEKLGAAAIIIFAVSCIEAQSK